MIDSLSTLIIMNLTEEHQKAIEYFSKSFSPNGPWSLFEFIIRIFGGILSAYDLTGEEIYRKKAIEIGEAIYPIFDQTGFYSPGFRINTINGTISASGISRGSELADVGSIQLEFLTLGRITKQSKYIDLALRAYKQIWGINPKNAIIASPYAFHGGKSDDILSLGSGTDSYYEYIIKSYLITGGISKKILKRHLMMMKELKRDRYFFKTKHFNLTGIGIKRGQHIVALQEHLTTFAAGMIVSGSVKENPNAIEDLEIAGKLASSYAEVYQGFKSGVMAESVVYNVDKDFPIDYEPSNDKYLLRPESIESVYYMWKFTGLQKYRDYAWEMFKGINRSCWAPYGYASIMMVDSENPEQANSMDSYFFAETMKYFYLIFSDSRLISPTEWVFNTEAHPLRIWSEDDRKQFSSHFRLL